MPESLGLIPLGTPIVEKDGTINIFFRQRWQELQASFAQVPTKAAFSRTGQTAALGTTTLLTVIGAGNYRVAVALLKTIADGVASSLTVTLGWVSRGVNVTKTFAALATDAIGANDCSIWQLYADANSAITLAIAYASTTPNQMKYNADATVEFMA